MKASSVNVFRKTMACPSSTLLLSYRANCLAPEVEGLVNRHLDTCDFCQAEVALLEHHSPRPKGVGKAPDLPINLRILAESLLSQSRTFRQAFKKRDARHGLLLK